MVMNAYPVPGKRKSFELCQFFIEGAMRRGCTEDAAVFSGIVPGNVNTWRQVLKSGRPYYYIDNSYFDDSRHTHFRVTKNDLQYHGRDLSSGARLRAIFGGFDPKIKPFQDLDEGHILIVPQSDVHMELTIGYHGDWLAETVRLCANTWPTREIKIRSWSANKHELAKTLPEDLADAHRLVTHTSAAAITALLHGVSVVTDSRHALADWVMSTDPTKDQRLHAFQVLADNQWTLEELKQGKAWAWLSRTNTGSL
jgi:hypothetical protein